MGQVLESGQSATAVSAAEVKETARVSVLIATRNRPDDLAACLRSIRALCHPSFEVVVADQSDSADSEQAGVAVFSGDDRLHYLRTSSRGKSAALNELVSAAQGEILAFTDDDTEAPSDWLEQIERVFAANPEADVVFGQVLPVELNDPDAYVPSFRFTEQRYLRPGEISGMGANMAMRRRVARMAVQFDPFMGPGAPIPASEEGDFVYRVQKAGAKVLHDPTVVLVHRAWRSGRDWNRVLESYGLGDAAFAMKHLRCGDWSMIWRLWRHLSYYSARLCYRILCRREHQEEHYLRGYWRGMKISRRFAVDRRSRLYVAPSGGQRESKG